MPQIQSLADSEKEALGFWPEGALREAIARRLLLALVIDQANGAELAGYIHYSGVFPHAKVQQIATRPIYRRVGAAAALVNALVSNLEHIGFMTLKAEVAADLPAALAFYAKQGFKIFKSRPGGAARNRTIVVHVRDLETDSLLSPIHSQVEGRIELGIRRRSAGEDPIFAFDLNVYFDLVRNRTYSENARALFGAALAHHIRLVVADEFVVELRRTTKDAAADPILQMALRLPRLPSADKKQLKLLADRIHEIVFVRVGHPDTGSERAISDATHLAHAALGRSSAFVTRDGAMLDARSDLLTIVGIDVVALDELVALLPKETVTSLSEATKKGEGFEVAVVSPDEASDYLSEASVSGPLIAEFTADRSGVMAHRYAIKAGLKVVGLGLMQTPTSMNSVARLLIHVKPEQIDGDMFADHLLDRLTRLACSELATSLELVHLPGQSVTSGLAQARGFVRPAHSAHFTKVAMGRPVTSHNWESAAQEIRRRTGLALPANMPSASAEPLSIITPAGVSVDISPTELENLLSPALFIWPDRSSAIVPIEKGYAKELLGTSEQGDFEFVKSRDAAFFSIRSYANSPRAARVMRPETPILFYESLRSGGRGAIVAVARVIDAVIVKKEDVPDDRLKRLVVDKIKELSKSQDILLTSFDNLFVFPTPVNFGFLRRLKATGGTNLVSAVAVSGKQASEIIGQGWLGGRAR